MTPSADIYGIVPCQNGGYVLVKTNFADGVDRVDTPSLLREMRRDHSLHFVTFAFEEIDMLQEYWKEDGTLGSCVRHHLVPIAIFGSMKNCYNLSIELDVIDFKKFGEMMKTRGAIFDSHFCMDGLKQMGSAEGFCWHKKIEVVK